MSAWPRPRRRFAAIATGLALLTGVAGGLLGGADWAVRVAVAYALVAVGALFAPAAIAVQVILGQVLAGLVLLEAQGPAAALALPLVAAVVLTAELLGTVARLDSPLEPAPSRELGAAGLAATVAAVALGVVLVVGEIRGPTGLAAILIGAGAAAGIAILLKPEPRRGREPLESSRGIGEGG